MKNSLAAFVSKMEKAQLSPWVVDTFCHYYQQIAAGETGLLSDNDILPVSPEDISDARSLQAYSDAGHAAMKKTVAIVLNGGLGTSMGLTTAKSLVPVKEGKSFLEIKLKQAERCGAQMAFMNSYNTHQETLAAVTAIKTPLKPLFFLQSKFPKVLASNLEPVHWPENPELEWNPPGHGDVYAALNASGLLKQLLDSGIEYGFIANSDNLGATLDDTLLGYFATHGHSLMMEVAERTPADLKGGHLARQKTGNLILREVAQCPENELAAFQDITRYRYFNTNNLWINLKYLKAFFDKSGALYLPIIVNPKTVDPRNADSPKAYQIETAMGAAVALFPDAIAVRVSEDRFLPVKKCQDLLALRSDCYLLTESSRLMMAPNRKTPPPKITLDPEYFGHMDAFNRRFKWVPSLIECESLDVQGNIFFEKNVTIAGKVNICSSGKAPVSIPSGSIIRQDLLL